MRSTASQPVAVAADPTAGDRLAEALRQVAQLDVVPLLAFLDGFAAEPAQAATLYKTWIACNPDHPALHAIYFNYAVCLTQARDPHGAVNALREALRIKPDFAPPYINLGRVLEDLGQPGRAVQTWLALVTTLSAVTPDALSHKVMALKQTGRVLEAASNDGAAEDALRQALELDPTQQDAIQHLVALRQRQCKWPALAATDRLAPARMHAAISPLSAAWIADDPMFQLASGYHYARRTIGIPPVPAARSLTALSAADRSRRLRVGYVSSDMREHAVGFAMTDVMEQHDPERVETFVYDCGVPASDATRARIARAAGHWTDLNPLTDAEAAQTIRQHGIDILVDLNGYTKDARTGIFAQRPAPVAVNWFGFPGSMGSPYHHYIIADANVIPPGREPYYAEQVLRLPCYQPNDRKRVVADILPRRSEAGLPEAGVVFCCLNGLQKLTAAMFGRWTEILRQVPDSVLWLLTGTADTNARLQAAAAAAGVAPERLVFADKLRNPEHLARLQLGDLFLDTFPYGAHTTASDAMWQGVPVLTLQGRSFASRVCASLVAAAGIPETICRTPDEYVRRAVELATDRPALAALRARLVAGRDTCTLFDTPGLVRALKALYEQMREAAQTGCLPRPDLTNLDLYHEIGASLDPDEIDTWDDARYRACYRERFAEVHRLFPVPPDHRLWDRPA